MIGLRMELTWVSTVDLITLTNLGNADKQLYNQQNYPRWSINLPIQVELLYQMAVPIYLPAQTFNNKKKTLL